ncbi:DUF2163 domain-containing protein [Roseobacter litoralis]|uniref:DUF2163 domain-containing protein n=1 Tax=Roseobacter litoralis TaxID=42443 RepID=UPI002494322E|nr:DUF2163 domain-containing protein [Roseobacter litoralis]
MTAYTDSLESGSTTLCRCFKLTRPDGLVMGFTDHDGDVDFDGVTFRAQAALTATEAAYSLGLAPDEMEASGAFAADAITESDLARGAYDGAAVEVWDVDWSTPATRHLLHRYTIGQVERGGLAFRAELRSLAAGVDRSEGRVHTTLCDARRLGDNRCKLNLAGWQGSATVVDARGLEVFVSGLEGFQPGIFTRGIADWNTGANAGSESDIRIATLAAGITSISLWRAPASPILPGDTLTATAGCNRTASTCANRFSNLLNFRGFPHMPGEAFLREVGRDGDPDQTGGSRFE